MCKLKINIIIIGVSSIITQLLLFREIYSVVLGNELVFGILLSLWLMLSGLGTFISKYIPLIKKELSLQFIHILLSVLPIISVLGIGFSRVFLFEYGVMLDIMEVTLLSLFWIAPYSIIAGIALIKYTSVFKQNNTSAKVYLLDLIGASIGGMSFYIFFLMLLSSYDALYFMLVINIISAFILASSNTNRIIILLVGILLLLLSLLYLKHFEELSQNLLFPEQRTIIAEDTPYGRLVITKTDEQYNFFEDGTLLFSTNSTMKNEEAVNFPLAQLDTVKNVFMVSGGISGMAEEVLKYKPERIDYVEINAALLDHSNLVDGVLSDPKIRIFNEDGRKFLKNTNQLYDAILLNVPPPANAQINRYFTREFFQIAKEKMTESAVFSLYLPATTNYISSEQNNAQSVVYSTLKSVFDNVIIFPGLMNYYVASDSDMTYDIIQRIEYFNIENEYVNQYYYDLISITGRAYNILSTLDSTATINSDFKPLAYFSEIQYLLSYFDDNDLLILLIFEIPLLLYAIKSNSINYGLFVGGFAASSVQFIFILAFQVVYGYAYEFMSVIFAVFMLGLAFGAVISVRTKVNISLLYRNILLFMAIFILLLPYILGILTNINYEVLEITIFIIMILMISVLGGMQFPTAGELLYVKYMTKNESIASQSFSSDYFGASLGALITSFILIPLLGIQTTCYIIAVLVLSSYLIMLVKK
jgi:spermidine synthase